MGRVWRLREPSHVARQSLAWPSLVSAVLGSQGPAPRIRRCKAVCRTSHALHPWRILLRIRVFPLATCLLIACSCNENGIMSCWCKTKLSREAVGSQFLGGRLPATPWDGGRPVPGALYHLTVEVTVLVLSDSQLSGSRLPLSGWKSAVSLLQNHLWREDRDPAPGKDGGITVPDVAPRPRGLRDHPHSLQHSPWHPGEGPSWSPPLPAAPFPTPPTSQQSAPGSRLRMPMWPSSGPQVP